MIDYSTYSLDDLLDARASIDESEYPERAEELDRLIQERKQKIEEQAAAHGIGLGRHSEELRSGYAKFHGKAGEYFKIWIVNLLLSIVTLGIYSAWAKVRTNRYFYSNTEVDGHRFKYLAEPMQILRGRLVAVALFGLFYLLAFFNPIAGLVLGLILAALTPFIVVIGVRFKMRMTSYRNVRFNFKGKAGDAFINFVLMPFLAVFTFYLLFPYVLKRIDLFLVENTTFGDQKVNSGLSTGEYYVASFLSGIMFGIIFLIGAAVLGGAFGIATIGAGAAEEEVSGAAAILGQVVFFALYFTAFAVSSSYYTAKIRNHIYNSSAFVDCARFTSEVSFGSLFILRVTNLIAIIFTLGMALPWVMVRNARFFADATKVHILSGIDNAIDTHIDSKSAVAEEAATLFDIDIAVG